MARTSNHFRYMMNTTVLCGALSFSIAGTAQEDANDEDSSVSVLFEEIVVTARKREESLADLPLSVSAFSGDSLEVRGVSQIDSLGRLTPNVTFQNNPSFGGSSNSAAIRIRGIGAADFTPTTDPGVGVYVNGVYLARSVGSILDILEFERVEVLRGPQGTLFGRNTIGGAINIITKRPTDETSFKGSVTYGTDNQIDAQASVDFPLSDTFFVKIAGGTFNQDGYVKRADGIELGDDSTVAGRIDFRWEASDNFSVDLSLDGSSDRENGPPLSLIDIRYGPQTIDPSTPPFVFFNNIAATLGGAVPNPLPPGPPPPECATEAAPINAANPFCYDDRYITGVNGTNLGTAPAFSNSDIFGASLTLSYDVFESLTIKSITSYRDLDSQFARDGDHSPLGISAFFDDLQQDQFSQEIQFLGSSFDDRLQWIVGLYYFKEDGQNVNNLDFLISSFRSGGFFENKSLAVFGQGTFDITDRLHLTAGLRWTDDDRSFLPDQEILTFNPNTAGFLAPPQQFIFQPGTPVLPSVEARQSAQDATPMVNLSYDATDDLLIYGSFSQGFKSGGFTQRVLPPLIPGITCEPDPAACIPGFEPEFVDVYEAGFRYKSPDNFFRMSGAAFYTDYSDLQISTFTSVAPVVRNAAAATIKGFEFEFIAAPTDTFLIEGSVGYTDADFDSIDLETRVDVDSEFERVSKWSLNVGASKDFRINDEWTATLRGDWSYRSRYFNDAFNSPQIAQDGFSLIDASVTLRNTSGLSAAIGAKNLTDKNYLATGVFGDAFSSFEGIFDRGRQWFIRVGFEY